MIEPLPFFQNFSRLRVFSETQKGSPILFFGNVSEKHVDRNSWYSSPLLSIENFDTGVFLKNRTLPPPKVLGYVIMTLFHGNSWYSLVLFHRRYRFWNFSEVQKASSTKSFSSVREKLFDWNSWYSLALIQKSFDFGIFLEDRRVPLQAF